MEQVASKPHHHVTKREDRVSIFQKTAYSMGSFANTAQAAFIGQMVMILNLGLGVNPAIVGFIGFLPRIVDAISDPITGYFSDNLRTRWGRRRPLILVGAILGGILFALMFQLYKGRSEMFYVGYFLFFQLLFFLAFTVFSIPWIALGYEMTPDYHERTRLQAVSSFAGQLPWFIAPWTWMIMHNKAWFTDGVHGVRVIAIVIGACLIIGGVLPAIFSKEFFTDLPKPDTSGAKNVTKKFFSGVATSFQCLPFVKLCGATLLIFGGFMLASAFTAYIVFYYIFQGAGSMGEAYSQGGKLLGWYGSFSALCSVGVIFLTSWLATHIGKRKTFFITIPISIFGYALKWIAYNPNNPYLLLISAPFIAFGLGSLFVLMNSMVADVCDLDELKTGERREGTFSAVYWWMVKLGVALSSLISGFLINMVGFDVALELNQSVSALFWMRICDVGIPVVTSTIAVLIIVTFKISEDKAYDIRAQIERRRGERRQAQREADERRGSERRHED
ncbi:MAG: MFS transporter [Candidatus Omnitrophica bacterium]|nr:MFS transporter [Candidatus Omnitrophota bacterium]